jgi:DNA invertase Pin-like site-specific DNA recombinase
MECRCGRVGNLERTQSAAATQWIAEAARAAVNEPDLRLVSAAAPRTPRGRRRKLTDQHIAQAVQRLMEGAKDVAVATEFGIGRSTLYRALRRFKAAQAAFNSK